MVLQRESSALFESNHTRSLCIVHGCSNRSDMNAGISAHFSPTIKSERDKWLRLVYTHRENFNSSGKFVAGVSPFRRGMFFKSRFIWKAVVVGLFLA